MFYAFCLVSVHVILLLGRGFWGSSASPFHTAAWGPVVWPRGPFPQLPVGAHIGYGHPFASGAMPWLCCFGFWVHRCLHRNESLVLEGFLSVWQGQGHGQSHSDCPRQLPWKEEFGLPPLGTPESPAPAPSSGPVTLTVVLWRRHRVLSTFAV